MNEHGEYTADGPEAKLCWYCGQWRTTHVFWGETIGGMVYSSSICVSLRYANGLDLQPRPPEIDLHTTYGGLKICDECVYRLATSCGTLPDSYIEEHRQRYELQLTEVANFDTGLMTLQERIFRFGCWLRTFPDVNVRQRFQSLELAKLYDLGFRLQGKVDFGEPEFQQFVDRFCSEESDASPEFLDHITKHITAPSPLLRRLAGLRAVIFDVSIVLSQRWLDEKSESESAG
jgi:hypothetical protein